MNRISPKPLYDITIIGGGIHATSLAAEASSRGLSVLVVQANDFAAGASGGSPCIVSGELKRIENLNLIDLKSTLNDLQQVHTMAPHLVQPTAISLLEHPCLQAKRRTRLSVGVYKRLFPSSAQSADPTDTESPLPTYTEFCLNRNRLILAYAQYATNNGAHLVNYCKMTDAKRTKDEWIISLESTQTPGIGLSIKSKILINSSGWQVSQLLASVIPATSRCRTTHVNTGRLIIKRPTPPLFSTSTLALQRADGSITYVTPLDEKYLSIEPLIARNDSNEAQDAARQALFEDWQQVLPALDPSTILREIWTRQAMPEDYANHREGSYSDSLLDLNNPGKLAVLLNVFGLCPGKHRKLAEQALDILKPFTKVPRNNEYTKQILPGGAPVSAQAITRIYDDYPSLEPSAISRIIHTYAEQYETLLYGNSGKKNLGRHFGHGLYAAEVDYLIKYEWVLTAEDLLCRRTHLELEFSPSETALLNDYILSATTTFQLA